MAIPKQVQDADAAADEYYRQLQAQRDAGDSPAAPQDTDGDGSPPSPANDPEPQQASPAETPPPPPAEDFRQKYLTLQGKYNKEIPGLHQQIRDLTAKLEDVTQRLQERQTPAPVEEVTLSSVTDKDRDEFGEDYLDVTRRIAQDVARAYTGKFEKQMAKIDALQAELQAARQATFQAELHRMVPDFDQVDADERWIAWLNEYDPMLQGPRYAVANAAYQEQNARAVADFVAAWKATLPPVTNQRQQRQNELERQVTPDRVSAPARAQGTGSNARIYSEREMAEGWSTVRKLNARSEFERASQLEAELTAAHLEGRVR